MPKIQKGKEKGTIRDKNGNDAFPPSIDTNFLNRVLVEKSYANFKAYTNPRTAKRGMDRNNWPKMLQQSLDNEHEKLKEITELLIKSREAEGPSVVIDCGCGMGRYIPWELENFGQVYGIDFSKTMLKMAAKNSAYETGGEGVLRTKLVLGDMARMDGIPFDVADMAICPFNTLGTIDPGIQPGIIQRIKHVLKPSSSKISAPFFFTFYLDNNKTKEMQREFYEAMGFTVKNVDYELLGRHFTVCQHPEGFTFKSQRFTPIDILEMLGDHMGIFEKGKLSPAMGYAIAVPRKGNDVMGGELIAALRASREKRFFFLLAGGAPTETRDEDGNTPLAIAARRGDDAISERLIKAGADRNARNYRGETPLMLACENNNEMIMRMLIRGRADINLEDAVGESALMKACRWGNERIVNFLLEERADNYSEVERKVQNLGSLGRYTAAEPRRGPRSNAILLAAENGHTGIVKFLLENKGINVSEEFASDNEAIAFSRASRAVERDSAGNNAIVAAAKNGYLDIVRMLFQGTMQMLGGRYANSEGTTPLMAAASHGHKDILEFLLGDKEYLEKAINQRDRDGKTALMHALGAKHFEIAKILIEAGIDVNLPETESGEKGDCPLHMIREFSDEEAAELAELMISHGARLDDRNKKSETPLFSACRYGKDKTAKVLLRRGADPDNAGPSGRPAIFEACTLRYARRPRKAVESIRLFRAFMEAGTNPHMRDLEGKTLLHLAAMEGNIELAKVLLEEFKLDVNATSKTGRTALMHACAHGQMGAIRILLDNGADAEIRDEDGETASGHLGEYGRVFTENEKLELKRLLGHNHVL